MNEDLSAILAQYSPTADYGHAETAVNTNASSTSPERTQEEMMADVRARLGVSTADAVYMRVFGDQQSPEVKKSLARKLATYRGNTDIERQIAQAVDFENVDGGTARSNLREYWEDNKEHRVQLETKYKEVYGIDLNLNQAHTGNGTVRAQVDNVIALLELENNKNDLRYTELSYPHLTAGRCHVVGDEIVRLRQYQTNTDASPYGEEVQRYRDLLHSEDEQAKEIKAKLQTVSQTEKYEIGRLNGLLDGHRQKLEEYKVRLDELEKSQKFWTEMDPQAKAVMLDEAIANRASALDRVAQEYLENDEVEIALPAYLMAGPLTEARFLALRQHFHNRGMDEQFGQLVRKLYPILQAINESREPEDLIVLRLPQEGIKIGRAAQTDGPFRKTQVKEYPALVIDVTAGVLDMVHTTDSGPFFVDIAKGQRPMGAILEKSIMVEPKSGPHMDSVYQ